MFLDHWLTDFSGGPLSSDSDSGLTWLQLIFRILLFTFACVCFKYGKEGPKEDGKPAAEEPSAAAPERRPMEEPGAEPPKRRPKITI